MPDSPASECFPLKPRTSLIAVFSTAEAGNCAGSQEELGKPALQLVFAIVSSMLQQQGVCIRGVGQKSTLMSGGVA